MRKSGVDSYSESHQHYRTSPTLSRSDQRQMCCPERKQKMKIFSTLSLSLLAHLIRNLGGLKKPSTPVTQSLSDF